MSRAVKKTNQSLKFKILNWFQVKSSLTNIILKRNFFIHRIRFSYKQKFFMVKFILMKYYHSSIQQISCFFWVWWEYSKWKRVPWLWNLKWNFDNKNWWINKWKPYIFLNIFIFSLISDHLAIIKDSWPWIMDDIASRWAFICGIYIYIYIYIDTICYHYFNAKS